MHVNQMAEAAAEEAQCTKLQAENIIRSLFVEAAIMVMNTQPWHIPGIGYISITERLRRWYKDPITGAYKLSRDHYGIRLAHSKGAILRERAEYPIP